MNANLLAAAAVCLVVEGALGQVTPHEKTLPRAFAGSWSGTGSNAFPLGRTRGLFQQWYRGDNLRTPSVITSIGVREARSVTAPAQSHMMELVMSNTSVGFGLSKTFTSNLGAAPITFLKMTTLQYPAMTAPPASPNAASMWVAGDRPFVFTGPHLIIQFDIQTTATYGSTPRRTDGLYQTSVTAQGGAGTRCGSGSLTMTYAAPTLTIALSSVPPSAPAFFLIGFDPQTFGGLVPLPVDLAPLGMPTCSLDVDPLFVLTANASASGSASIMLPIPLPPNDTYPIHAQGMHLDPSKPGGLATTNNAWWLIGNADQSNYIYNWSRDGATAEYGPYPVNSNVVVLYR